MPKQFFLRFYGKPQSTIDECLEKIRQETHANFTVTKKPVTLSVNVFVSALTGENTEAMLHFKSDSECMACYNNPKTMEIYQSYSTNGKVVKRKPKDVAWS